MKKVLLIFLLVFSIQKVSAQFIIMPDTILRNYLQQKVPACFSNNYLDVSIAGSTPLDSVLISNMGITSLEGLQYFLYINYMNCSHNQITQFPPGMPSVVVINCSYNQLTSFNLNAIGRINCAHNQITSISFGGSNIHDIDCSYNLITSLPPKTFTWVGAYTYFNCSNNMLSSLPSGYGEANILDISNNNFSALPTVSYYLQSLNCSGNIIDTIDIASTCPNIGSIDCSNNHVTMLGSYPGLSYLNCSNNQLTYIPVMGNPLTELNCSHNQITSLQQSPTQKLNCSYNPISCLPVLNTYMDSLNIDSTLITCLPNIPITLSVNFPICSSDTLTCETFPAITGKVFLDLNGNNIADSGETGLPNWIIETMPYNWYGSSDANGVYYTMADTGVAVSVSIPSPPSPYYTVIPAAYNFNFNSLGIRDTANDFAVYPVPNSNDLKLDMYGFSIMPGFTSNYYLTCTNIGTTTQNAFVSFTYDDSLNIVATYPPYDSVSGNTLFWNIPGFIPLSTHFMSIELSASASLPLGYPLNFSATLFPVVNDLTVYDNSVSISDVVVGSFDPNAKHCNKSYIGLNEVADEVWLSYDIQFQNTGTYAAYNILLKDTLPANLNLSTIQIIAASHPYTFRLSEHGIAEFRFNNIMLPDSLHDEPNSHGFIKFRIKCSSNLQVNDQVENTAYIYFDYNTPVQTNTAITNVINSTTSIQDFEYAGIKVYPNPVSNDLTIECNSEIKRLTLFDMGGRKLLISNLGKTCFKTHLNTSSLRNGIYNLQIEAKDRTYYIKLVK